jgi:acyl-Coa thioesterase superfamily protein/acyl-CoA thioesterase superfamily protein
VPDAVFLADGERFVPSELARGPWDPNALHGGAPAALITSVLEAVEPGQELSFGRLGFEFLRPIPMASLSVVTRIVRPGRRVQELAGELYAHPDGGEPVLICRASALRVSEVPGGLPSIETGAAEQDSRAAMGSPAQATPRRYGLNAQETATSFAADAMEMRWFGDPWKLGPGRVWMRLGPELVAGRRPSPLTRLAATADFGNGVSASLPFEQYLFINADLHIHLHREPRGEWIGLDSRTVLDEHGTGLAESVLHDQQGPVGRAFQTLVVQPR